MKIAFDATAILGNSGIETYSRELIRSIIDNFTDHMFFLYTVRKRAARLEEFFGKRDNAVYQACFPHSLMLGKMGRGLMERVHEYKWKSLSRSVDLIHYTNPFLVPRVNNYAITIHDIIPLYNEPYVSKDLSRRFKKIIRQVANNARLIIVPTQFVKNELVEAFPFCRDRVQVVYEAAGKKFRPLEPDKAVLGKYGLGGSTRYFLYVGRIEDRKNLGRIVKAYSLLPASVKSDVKLVLVANGKSPLADELKNTIIQSGEMENVRHLMGVPESDLIQLYSSALGFVFPTLSEGFGLPVIEAMQCGCPVISSNISCIPEIAADSAILVNPYETEEIFRAMDSLVTDDGLRADLIRKGLDRASVFSWQKAARMTVGAYETTMSNQF